MTIPAPLARPKIAQWRYDRNLSLVKTAELITASLQILGLAVTCSDETVRLMCLPFGNKRRRVPGPEILRAIEHMTACQVLEADFYPIKVAA